MRRKRVWHAPQLAASSQLPCTNCRQPEASRRGAAAWEFSRAWSQSSALLSNAEQSPPRAATMQDIAHAM